eukprot:6315714-Pyramimonas_sp.AAC.1
MIHKVSFRLKLPSAHLSLLHRPVALPRVPQGLLMGVLQAPLEIVRRGSDYREPPCTYLREVYSHPELPKLFVHNIARAACEVRANLATVQ